ncbi:MAG: hypothetical protein JNL58_14585 [Planctomyces sp.]|nr:hypothetical protein [Planctomyces sp.]
MSKYLLVVLVTFCALPVLKTKADHCAPRFNSVDRLFRSDAETLFRGQSPETAEPSSSGGFDNGLNVNTTTLQAVFPILQEDTLMANFGFEFPRNYCEAHRRSKPLCQLWAM